MSRKGRSRRDERVGPGGGFGLEAWLQVITETAGRCGDGLA